MTLNLFSGTSGFDYNAASRSGSGDLTRGGIEYITGTLTSADDTISAGAQIHSLFAVAGYDVLKLDYSQGLAGVTSTFSSVRLVLNKDGWS